MRHFRLRAAVAACAVILAACQGSADEVQDAFEKLYGDDARQVTATPDRKDDADFAAKLLKAAESIPSQSPLRILLCEKAYEFAVRGQFGYATAIEAIARLAAAAPDRKDDCDEKTLTVRQLQYRDAKPGEEKTKAGQALLDPLVAAGDGRAAAARFIDAVALYRQAQALATFLHSPQADEVQAKLKAASSRIAAEQQAGQLKARLHANPQDKAAAAQLFLLLLVEMDNPGQAAAYADLGTDDATKKYVLAAGMTVENLPENACLQLADWYKGLAEAPATQNRNAMLLRAKAYYERYLELHPSADATRLKAATALEQVTQRLGPAAPAAGALKEIIVEGDIDGDTQLWVTPKGLYWKCMGAAKVGRNDGKNEAAYINGKPWMPQWGKPDEARGRDECKPFPLAIGKVDFTCELVAIGAERGTQGIDKRDSLNIRAEGDALVVGIPDHQGGDRWYRLRLFRSPPPRPAGKGFTPSGTWIKLDTGIKVIFESDGQFSIPDARLVIHRSGRWKVAANNQVVLNFAGGAEMALSIQDNDNLSGDWRLRRKPG